MNDESLKQPSPSRDVESFASDGACVQKWYFTFGSNHAHPNGYVVIEGTFKEAREEMIELYGRNWSMQYKSAEVAGVEKYCLYEVRSCFKDEILVTITDGKNKETKNEQRSV